MPREHPKAVLFDLDGTLLDTLADIAAAMNTALEHHGFPPHPVDAYRSMVGSGLRALVERALGRERERVPEETVASLAGELRDYYTRHATDRTVCYDGVPELLDALARREIPCAVLSNKADALVQQIVGELLSGWEFRAVMGLREGAPAKPDPATALEAADALGVEPGAVLYLGDSDVDMETAIRAGMLPVGAGWGFRGAEELRRAGAVVVVEHPADVLPLLNGGATES